jgi:hypothetical protein
MNPSTRISQCTLFMLVAVALPLSEASTVKGCGVGSVQTPVTSSGRIVLRMVGNCSEEFVSIELQRENGPAGKHLVPFDIHRRGTIRNSPLGHPDPSLTIVFLDPIARLETGGDYRLTVRDRTKNRHGQILVNPANWTVEDGLKVDNENHFTRSAYSVFTVADDSHEEEAAPEPEITGHTIGRRELFDGQIAVKLCVSTAGLSPGEFSSFLWVIEMLWKDGRWVWASARRPSRAMRQDPRCGFIASSSTSARPWQGLTRPSCFAQS